LFWRKKTEDQPEFKATDVLEMVNAVVKKLELREGEEVLGALPAYIGVRDFDPAHSFSCGSVRDKVTSWRLGAFINTTQRLIFKQLEEDGSLSRTILNVPLKGIYTVEVSEVEEKHLEMCTDAGSFEFKGFVDDEGTYKIAEALQNLSDSARNAEYPRLSVIKCEYCGAKNKPDSTYCVNCGALIR
jgi:hypothetical protein